MDDKGQDAPAEGVKPDTESVADVGPITPGDVQQVAASMVEQAQRIAANTEKGGPIRIDVEDQEFHEGEYVEFHRKGWRFKDLRLYEEAMSTSQLAAIVCKRIADWKLTVAGKPVPFKPKALRKQLLEIPLDSPERVKLDGRLERSYAEAMDELDGYLASFIWAAYRTAYSVASALGPNA
jgi:hypothetical protein